MKIIGDIICLYLSLYLALLIRPAPWSNLFWPFTLIFAVWLLVIFIAGLYDEQDKLEFYSLLWKTLAINTMVAIFIFYLSGPGPKRILLLQVIFFALLFTGWRHLFRVFLKKFPDNILLIGKANIPQDSRYNLIRVNQIFNFKNLIKDKKINTIVIASNPHLNPATTAELFQCLPIKFLDLPSFYEKYFKKIPITNISRVWFLENINSKRVYEIGKRVMDIIMSALGFISLPLWLLIALAIKWDSKGSIFYKHTRIGRNNKKFTVLKFRTMTYQAGPKWTEDQDPRITRVGSFLRRTHLDELPQLINILRGNLSLIGPRAENIELVQEYQKNISFYPIRHLIKPGLTGWAQIKFSKGTLPEHTREKLEYDFFYIKNRSLVLDLAIALRTIKSILD